MPAYDYECRKCGHPFTQTLTVEEHDRKKPRCPKCKSEQVERLLSAFFPVTSKKS